MSRRLEQQAAPVGASVTHVYPIGSRLNEAGHLEIGGCDVFDVAREFGTPAYVYAVEDIRARARAYMDGFRARTDRFEVIYASKAFPCTAAYRLLAAEGIAVDVASGGELFLALKGGFKPEKIFFHGNNKSRAEIEYAQREGVGHIVIDSFHEIGLIEAPQKVMLRVRPGIKPSTHDYIATGQVDSKFGFGLEEVPAAIEAVRARGLELVGLHAHIGSQIFDLGPWAKLGEVLGELGDYPLLNLGGGLGVAYTADDEPPAIDDYVDALVSSAPDGVTILCEPGRSLVANAGVTLYTVGAIKEIPGVRTYVDVDGGMSDNLRPMLYGARYEAQIADRFGGATMCTVAGKHCESSDILVRDVELDDPRPGDLLVTPATGGYGHAMANNYNAIPRPPVIFCENGEARAVVRRETYEDLALRDL
jgi:diaminopimelate decarboxylase